jgi:hypothetical protein
MFVRKNDESRDSYEFAARGFLMQSAEILRFQQKSVRRGRYCPPVAVRKSEERDGRRTHRLYGTPGPQKNARVARKKCLLSASGAGFRGIA